MPRVPTNAAMQSLASQYSYLVRLHGSGIDRDQRYRMKHDNIPGGSINIPIINVLPLS